jgi:hypothetical protein
MSFNIILMSLLIFSFISCSQSDKTPADGASQSGLTTTDTDTTIETGTSNEASTTPIYSISLEFERVNIVGSLDPFTVTATILENGSPKTGIIPVVSLVSGTSAGITEVSGGQYKFTVTPSGTGEYPVTVSFKTASVSRTALVTGNVDSDWGQPMSVSGLVNTEGYEDGVTITPDGEYLFVQTGPYFSSASIFIMNTPRAENGCGGVRAEFSSGCDISYQCMHEWVNSIIGPYTAPQRPGFFSGRFNGTALRHNSNVWGVPDNCTPNFAMATMFYGFKRQSDGTFKEPFYLAFEDENDAIINPFGLSFKMNGNGTAEAVFSLKNTEQSSTTGFDVYAATVTMGVNNSLGKFIPDGSPGNPPVKDTNNFPSTPVSGSGIPGTQGNPHIYYDGTGEIKSIWVDDEYDKDAQGVGDNDYGEIVVYVLDSGSFPNGTWSYVKLPGIVNDPDQEEIQPFFTGQGLYFTRSYSDVRNPEIYYSAYSGVHNAVEYAKQENWSFPVRILEIADSQGVGDLVAVGEPTIATYKGEEYLYFVYAIIRGFDKSVAEGGTGHPDLNFQAGFVKKRPAVPGNPEILKINSSGWVDSPWISGDGMRMYFMYSRYNFLPTVLDPGKLPRLEGPMRKGHIAVDSNPYHDSDIYMSMKKPDGSWSKPVHLGFNDDKGDCCHVFVNNFKRVYYTKENGADGTDIYYRDLDNIGNYPIGPPVLVPGINSSDNEDNPHVNENDNLMWFTSHRDGINDIWFSQKDTDKNWTAPVKVYSGDPDVDAIVVSSINDDEDQFWVSEVLHDNGDGTFTTWIYFNRNSQIYRTSSVYTSATGDSVLTSPEHVDLGSLPFVGEASMPISGSDSESIIYFASVDTTDERIRIYYAVKNPDGTFQNPVLLD